MPNATSTRSIADIKMPKKANGTVDKRYTMPQVCKSNGTKDNRTTLMSKRK